MSPKHNASDASAGKTVKKRKTITMKHKLEIIERSEKGESPSTIGKALGYNRSTIGTIIKDKSRITDHVKGHAPMNATVITKQRSGLIIEMERLLTIWIEDQNQHNMPISLSLVQEKARSLFNDLKTAQSEHEGECLEEFVASRGWFNRFKGRANLHNIKVQGEAASADIGAARNFPQTLEDIIDKEDYLPEQIFNVDETGLFWKKMPERTYISKEEKSAPGHKAAKDRLTLLVGGNASGLKLKPLLVYQSLNPRALRNITKASLPVIWRSNPKAWVTAALFQDWFLNYFIPDVKRYCLDKNIPFKVLLLLDNAPGHPHSLDDLHPDVKVLFLPPNTTSLLQPMDQGVIATFKAYYLRRTFSQAVKATQNNEMTLREFWKKFNIYDSVKNIGKAWDEVKESTMKGVWKKLCPQLTQDFLGFTEEEIAATRQSLVAYGNELQLDITENDIIELLDSHSKDLSNEDLMELEKQMTAFEEENRDLESPERKKFTTKKLAEAFSVIEAGMAKLEEQDPDTERFTKVYRTITEGLRGYKVIYEEKKKKSVQSSLDVYFKKPIPPAETEAPPAETETPPAETEAPHLLV